MMINYQEYVESGITWIGKIPAHWGLSKIGRHFKLERGRVISNVEIANNVGKYPVYSSQTKNNGELGSINTYDFDGEYVSWTTDGANAGTCFYRKGKFNVTNVCGLISSFDIEIDYKYLSFFLNLGTKNFVRKDINPKLMNDMLSEIPILIVPIKDQKLISQYLDKKTQKIDSIIEGIEKKIKLLKEQKTALINQYVSKGIDPYVDLKESKIDWIGRIPKHWKTTKLKYLSKINVQYGLNIESDFYTETGVRFLRITDINNDGSLKQNGGIFLNESSVPKEFILNKGDLLFSRTGATVGKSTLINSNSELMSFAGYLVRFAFENFDISKFVSFFSQSSAFWSWINLQMTQSTIQNVNGEKYSNLNIPLPPHDEIKEINLYLEKKIKFLDKLISKESVRKKYLIEYRQSLIYAVITGKIRITEDML